MLNVQSFSSKIFNLKHLKEFEKKSNVFKQNYEILSRFVKGVLSFLSALVFSCINTGSLLSSARSIFSTKLILSLNS